MNHRKVVAVVMWKGVKNRRKTKRRKKRVGKIAKSQRRKIDQGKKDNIIYLVSRSRGKSPKKHKHRSKTRSRFSSIF